MGTFKKKKKVGILAWSFWQSSCLDFAVNLIRSLIILVGNLAYECFPPTGGG